MPIYLGTAGNPASIYALAASLGQVYKGHDLVWQKNGSLFWFKTNTGGEGIGEVTIGLAAQGVAWTCSMGDGEIIAFDEETFAATHEYADTTEKTVTVNATSQNPEVLLLALVGFNITSALNLSKIRKIDTAAIVVISRTAPETGGYTDSFGEIIFSGSIEGTLGTLWIGGESWSNAETVFDISMFASFEVNLLFSEQVGIMLSGGLFAGLTTPSATTGKVNAIELVGLPNVGEIDLSGYNFDEHSYLNLTNLPELETVSFPGCSDGSISTFAIESCNKLTGADLSFFNEISGRDGNGATIYLRYNELLETIDFADDITGELYVMEITDNPLITELDISMFDTYLDDATRIDLSGNTLLETIVFPTAYTGNIDSLVAAHCNLQGELDLSMLDKFSNWATINFLSNPITSVVFASSITGNFAAIDFSGCELDGTLDLTGIEVAELYLTGNSSLDGLVIDSTSIYFLDAYYCNLGYVDLRSFKINIHPGAQINLEDNLMTAAEVNHILADLNSIAVYSTNMRSVLIGGSNEAPDTTSGGYDGVAAKAALIAKNVSVSSN